MTDAQAQRDPKRDKVIARIARHNGITIDEANAMYPPPGGAPEEWQPPTYPAVSTNPFSAALATIGILTLLTGVILLIAGGVVANQDHSTIGQRFADISIGIALLQWGTLAAGVGVTALLVLLGVAAVRWAPKPQAGAAAATRPADPESAQSDAP